MYQCHHALVHLFPLLLFIRNRPGRPAHPTSGNPGLTGRSRPLGERTCRTQGSDEAHRLDFWFHGRDDKVNEVLFMERRRTQQGQYTPADTIVLHPYARFSNANKFAGEIDCLEALAHVKKNYRIDDDRITVRGFSMGGASCWQFAVHYADQWCAANPGRQRFPKIVRFETYTLRYHKLYWTQIDSMEEHWKRAYLKASYSERGITIEEIENISALTFSFPEKSAPFTTPNPVIKIDQQAIAGPPVINGQPWKAQLIKEGYKWKLGSPPEGLAKRHGLQGPIDDAFMSSFLFVLPDASTDDQFEKWEQAERTRAIAQWRQQFRGDVRVKFDYEVTKDDIKNHNLILWGNRQSNSLIRETMDELPVRWTHDRINVGNKRFFSKGHALVMIYPNPLNPERYIVLNSSFTYREFDDLNNARQVPKLPDWAIIDLSEASGPQRPGKIVDAGFFDENWQLKE